LAGGQQLAHACQLLEFQASLAQEFVMTFANMKEPKVILWPNVCVLVYFSSGFFFGSGSGLGVAICITWHFRGN